MADLGSYSFLPWLRRGMASRIARSQGAPPAPGSDPARVSVTVGVTVNADLTATIPLALIGPGEITGVDRDAIIRTAPPPDTFDVEPNYFPLLEFDQPDFPWRYTAARADASDRLTPWIALVVLRDDEIQKLREPGRAGGLPLVTVADASLLPPWGQLWAWAHVQISGARNVTNDQLRAIVESEPTRALSRLLCPRRLDPFTAYTAFLVPTYERGRRAGAGQPVPADLDALAPAWTDSGSVQLPVYFRWRFGTGATGDFEFLVRQLQASIIPPSVGLRDLNVNDPGAGLPPAFDQPLGLEGALRAIGTERTEWSGAIQMAFVDELAALLNLPADRMQQPDAERAVVPPLYGRWYARAERETPLAEPRWFNDLNQDPRERVAAGAGTRVVQQQQRQLMASAWQQVQGIREANQRLRLTQFARALAQRVFVRHLAIDDADQLLQVGAPVLNRIMASPTTIRARLDASPILPGVLDGQFRRITRPRGPMGRRQGRQTAGPWLGFSRMNRGTLRGAGPPRTPGTMTTRLSAPPGGVLTAATAVRNEAFASGTLTGKHIAEAPVRPDFAATEAAPGALTSRPSAGSRRTTRDSVSAAAFRIASTQLLTALSEPVAAPPPLEAVVMSQLRDRVTTALDPRTSAVAGLRGRLKLPDNVRQPTADVAEPVMAAPVFPMPMYVPLAALSHDWMLPGLADVPQNTVGTVLTNQRFIEAYLVGLNHEMARELQWNEYPTDMRGTYFRQFWDPAGSGGSAAELLDITAISEWSRASLLGTHGVRTPVPDDEQLVLLVRGDVFRRYPNTQVYAVKAKSAPGGVHALGDEERLPVFSGRLPPDVAFFGFELTPEEARGDESANSPNQGWFFVLQEHPSEPRFGLDVPDVLGGRPSRWSDLSWGHLAQNDAALAQIRYIDLTALLPDTTQVNPTGGARWHIAEGSRAADLAFISLQQPMRVAVHGSDMIPAPGSHT